MVNGFVMVSCFVNVLGAAVGVVFVVCCCCMARLVCRDICVLFVVVVC